MPIYGCFVHFSPLFVNGSRKRDKIGDFLVKPGHVSYGKTFLLQGPKMTYIQQKSRLILRNTKNRRKRGVTSLLTIAEIAADKRD